MIKGFLRSSTSVAAITLVERNILAAREAAYLAVSAAYEGRLLRKAQATKH